MGVIYIITNVSRLIKSPVLSTEVLLSDTNCQEGLVIIVFINIYVNICLIIKFFTLNRNHYYRNFQFSVLNCKIKRF